MIRRYNVLVYFSEKLHIIFLLLFFFLITGIVGFMMLEGLTFTEATYMTVITLSTVGYREVKEPSSYATMWFTIFLILSGVGVLTYSATIFAQELIDGRFLERYKQKQVERKISSFQNHVILCGFGRNGQQAARKLNKQKIPYVVVELDEELQLPSDFKDVPIVIGDATEDETLLSAGINKSQALIAALPSDSSNLFIVLTARNLNPNLKIVSRASNQSSVHKLVTAGADKVIMPDKLGGEQMARVLASPVVSEFMDAVGLEGQHSISMLEVKPNQFPREYLGKEIGELDFRNKTKCTVVGMKRADGKYVINPELESVLTPDTHLIFLGTPEQIEELIEHYQIK